MSSHYNLPTTTAEPKTYSQLQRASARLRLVAVAAQIALIIRKLDRQPADVLCAPALAGVFDAGVRVGHGPAPAVIQAHRHRHVACADHMNAAAEGTVAVRARDARRLVIAALVDIFGGGGIVDGWFGPLRQGGRGKERGKQQGDEHRGEPGECAGYTEVLARHCVCLKPARRAKQRVTKALETRESDSCRN